MLVSAATASCAAALSTACAQSTAYAAWRCPPRTSSARRGRLRRRSACGCFRKEKRRPEDRLVSNSCSVPDWPFGDWLPCGCVGRMKQIHGKVGLAGEGCPADRVHKHKSCRVQKLAC